MVTEAEGLPDPWRCGLANDAPDAPGPGHRGGDRDVVVGPGVRVAIVVLDDLDDGAHGLLAVGVHRADAFVVRRDPQTRCHGEKGEREQCSGRREPEPPRLADGFGPEYGGADAHGDHERTQTRPDHGE
ncbi:hypothetical protein [Streptomyces sp. NBC_00057]|uniref:hypothetical protein n=1 Tax=Streptomyces sp. NBC_00057 TaxID=2975634 RepID=UPI00324A72D7